MRTFFATQKRLQRVQNSARRLGTMRARRALLGLKLGRIEAESGIEEEENDYTLRPDNKSDHVCQPCGMGNPMQHIEFSLKVTTGPTSETH